MQSQPSINVAGTLGYVAPEVLTGQPGSVSADLYALGVIAYELFAGYRPFRSDVSIDSLIDDILQKPADVKSLHLNPELTAVLQRLLAKTPEHRFADAGQVIEALTTAVEQPFRRETAFTRESFLQAARLVGRDAELARLSEALTLAVGGRGSALLIGGESGIGKSRLLDELATQALIQGALVLRGRALDENDVPYHIWQQILRNLALASNLDDLEAGVLKTLVPDIAALLERRVPDAPPLDPEAAQVRLAATIADVLRRLREPVVIIVEDLHRATDEGLALLARLTRVVSSLPVMIAGSYRDDESPDLLARLPGMGVLKLKRLSPKDISRLAESILGAVGRKPEIVSLLQRECEGNVFFLVEAIRALAEQAGELDKIGEMPLPERIFAGGTRRIVERRLSRVPVDALPLLQAAAAVGHQLDLGILGALDPATDLMQWLAVCANTSILEQQDERWVFSLDKLRDGLLDKLTPEQRRALHQQVAEAIEVANSDQGKWLAALAYHWGMAGDTAKEAHWSALAGELALQNGVFRAAAALLSRATALAAQSAEFTTLHQASLERQLGQAYFALGDWTQGQEHLEHAVALLGWPVPRRRGQLIRGLLRQVAMQAIQRRIMPINLIRGRAPDRRARALEASRAYARLGQLYSVSGDTLRLIYSSFRGANLAETARTPVEMSQFYAAMCLTFGYVPLHSVALAYERRARATAESTNDLSTIAWVLQLTGIYDVGVGRWRDADDALSRAAEIADQIGDKLRWQESVSILAIARTYQGDIANTAQMREAIAAEARRNGGLQGQIWALLGQAESALLLGHVNDALNALDNLAGLAGANISHPNKISLNAGLAVAHLYIGEQELAWQAASSALELIAQSAPAEAVHMVPTFNGLAGVCLSLWEGQPSSAEFQAAARQANAALRKAARAFPIGQPGIWRAQGRMEWLLGNPVRAQKAWAKALDVAEKLAMPYEQALVHYEIGRHLSDQDPARTAHLERATELFSQLGAVYFQARARVALQTKN
jgi:eukaryotic-like serine/threonine-protein kinase